MIKGRLDFKFYVEKRSSKVTNKINKVLTSLALILGLILPLMAAEKKTDEQAAGSERYSRFLKGINLPSWFWLNKGKVGPLEKRFSEKDLRLIKELGFTFVRLPVDMANIYAPEREDLLKPEAMALLMAGIRKILDFGLAVNFDLHSVAQKKGGSDYSGPLGKDEQFTRNFFRFWEKLAEKLATFDPERLVIEPMNEPVFQGEESRWPPIQKELVAAIREKVPHHTILATGAFWSNLSTLINLQPLDDPDLWYVFHFYEPHIFTHQGAYWSSEWVKPLRQVPYPSSPEAVLKAISLVGREDIKKYLRFYGEERWDAQKIERGILKAVQWAEKNGVRLFCNEFGAYRKYCLPAYRIAWTKDVRNALEKYGIGWAMWEFDGSFGLVFREESRAVVDRNIASALGLRID